MHWQEINNHILLNKYGRWLGAILFRRDKQNTYSPSQCNCNAFWRLWVSWWDRCKGTKLLERSLGAKQSRRLPKNQSCRAVTTQRRRSQNEFPTLWLTLACKTCQLCYRNVTKTWIRHAWEKTSNRSLREERDMGKCKRQSKDGLIYEVWWSLSVAGKQWGDITLTK